MLTELCQELRNWFERDVIFGTFTIESGQINLPDGSLQSGQYFRIVGSVFNDGVHKYEPNNAEREDLHDEVFEGAIWAMAVPPTVIALSEKISAWMGKYGGADSSAMSPFQSESFGGYSYSKGSTGSSSFGGSSVPTWKSVFADELNRWRKI
jgi:hypothetical protein